MLGLGVGLRFPRLPGVVPFGSFTAPDPAPIRLPGLPVRSARAIRLASTGPCFPAVPSRHRTGVHRPSQHTDAGAGMQEEFRAGADTFARRGRRLAHRVRTHGRGRARRDPRRARDRARERRGDGGGLADARAARAGRRRAARCSVCTRVCRSPRADRSATAASRPIASRSSRDRWRSRARDLDELAAQVRVTVLHEVGHYFGMDDVRLHELGWA